MTASGCPAASRLGEEYDPLGVHLRDPYPLFARARTEEPVFWSPAVQAWVVTRYEDVRAALRDWETFSSANALRPLAPLPEDALAVLTEGIPPISPDLTTSNGEPHRRLRAPVMRGLSNAVVDEVEPFIRQRAEELVDGFAADGRVEFMGQYARKLPISVIAHLCGLTPDEAETAYAGSFTGSQVFFDRLPEPERAAAARAFVTFQQMCRRLVTDRRATPREDLISRLVAELVPGEEPLTDEQRDSVAMVVVTVILAGHVTTSGLLGSGLRHLLTDREQWELLCQKPELTTGAVEEILRYDGPTQAFRRITTREVTIGGRRLPEGSEVLVCFGAADHDPALCENPETFDITREPTRHVAFGAGPHACVGAPLARRQLKVTLETLIRRLPDLRLVPGQDFTVKGTLTVRELEKLHLTW